MNTRSAPAEFVAGTNPALASDVLEFLPMTAESLATLQFRGVAGRTYTVQYRDSLGTGLWQRLADVAAQPVSGPVTVVDPVADIAVRFYRVVTPALSP